MSRLEALCVDVATTAELTSLFHPNPQTYYLKFIKSVVGTLSIDGELITIGSVVLVKDQTNLIINGIYECTNIVVSGPNTEYTFCRTLDGLYLSEDGYVFVKSGSVNQCFLYVYTSPDDLLTIGVSDIIYKGVQGTNSGMPTNPTFEIINLNSSMIDVNSDLDITEVYINSGTSTGMLPNPSVPFIGYQKKILITSFTSGTYTLTIPSFVNGSGLTFYALDQSITLMWTSQGWISIGGAGATLF